MTPEKIYTAGHSTLSIEEFLAELKFYEIEVLVDIRRLPGSRKFPQFDQDNLKVSLEMSGIKYLYFKALGGRRKAKKDSKNTVWKNASFRGYADYMETDDFENALTDLENVASKCKTVFMCAEAVWWRCHRSMISDSLKAKGWDVLHIMGLGKVQIHPYTAPAKIVDGLLSYSE